jgi:hypothetical protein
MLTVVALLLCTAVPGSGEAGSPRGGRPGIDAGGGKSVRLSLKISGAKKRKRQVSFYKSVARQANVRSTFGRTLPSGR